METPRHAIPSNNLETNHDIAGNFILDTAVIAKLPVGTRVISADSFGSSAWTQTVRVTTIHLDGKRYRYFLKLASGPTGRTIAEGEFHSMTALFQTVPDFVPTPVAWGKCAISYPETYFYLSEFIDMSPQLPDPTKLCSALATLHRTSKSPTGQFGFHVTTCYGKFPQQVAWNSSWEAFFGNLLADSLRIDASQNGTWEELQKATERTITHVLPLLLRPLESAGRTLKPCLIHGDLWDGNIGTDYETETVYIFDAAAYYAHNEMDIAIWRASRSRLRSKGYHRGYLRNFGISEPVEQFDDRLCLYSVRLNLMHSALYREQAVRKNAYDDLCKLIKKYAPVEAEVGENGREEDEEDDEDYTDSE